ncbi:MAG: DUF6049 family protein, partial [Nocardioidaceae bacterium]
WAPRVGTALVRRQAADAAEAISKVTVSGPPFVAMSSDSGKFPITLRNGLDSPVTVRLVVTPENPALKIRPIDPIKLAPGQRRDVKVFSHAESSGLTTVHARLATIKGQAFGEGWQFDVRATQIGMVIWVVMGVGAVVLFGAAGYRIISRVRGSRRTREEPDSA